MVAGVLVQRAGERRAEAAHVRTALAGVDVVRERVNRLLVGGVPLHRDLRRALVALAGEEDDLAVNGVLVFVQIGDEVLDAALVAERRGVTLGALVDDRDLQAAGQERGLAEALLEGEEVELERLEDVGVGQEGDRVARALARGELPPLLELALWGAAGVLLGEHVAVAVDLDREALGQRVDHRDADPVQAAGDLVAATVAELAAGVEHGEHDFDCRASLLLHHGDGDAPAVVEDRDRVVRVDRNRHLGAETREGLVDRVVDDLVYEVMEPHDAGGSDVHAGALADRLETFENGDVLGVVAARRVADLGVVGAAVLGAVRAFAGFGQWASDYVRKPRNPRRSKPRPGRGECVHNNSTRRGRNGPAPDPETPGNCRENGQFGRHPRGRPRANSMRLTAGP